MYSLALVAKKFRDLSGSIIYRSLSLNDTDEIVAEKVQRLLDPNNRLSEFVRELKILECKGNHGILAANLCNIIQCLPHLHTFTCESRDSRTDSKIPDEVIQALAQYHPQADLVVQKHDRADTDWTLLSTPLLHSLSFSIHNYTATVTATDQREQYSKLPELRKVLLQSPNLKKLNIEFKRNWINGRMEWSGDCAHPALLQLPLEPTDRLPSLHELSFSGPPETYEFDLQHCILLRECMDWTHLQRLDLGISCPQYFFEQIGSQLSSLRALSMGIRTGDRRYKSWLQGPLTCNDLETVTRFLEALPRLHELRLTDFCDAAEEIVPAILTNQTELRVLRYHAEYGGPLVANGKISPGANPDSRFQHFAEPPH